MSVNFIYVGSMQSSGVSKGGGQGGHVPRAPLLGGAKIGKATTTKKKERKEEKKIQKKRNTNHNTNAHGHYYKLIKNNFPHSATNMAFFLFNAIKSIIKCFIHTIKNIKSSNLSRALDSLAIGTLEGTPVSVDFQVGL